MRSLLAILATASFASAQTPALTWITNPSNGHSYALTPQLNWSAAEALAQQHGGHLATIRNQAEQDWIVATFLTPTITLWIGLNDVQNEGTFVWASGEPVTYTNWAAGEPNNNAGIEDWTHVYPPFQAKWNDHIDVDFHWGYPSFGVIEVPTTIAATFSSFGSSCVGPTGLEPTLAPVGTGVPRIGSTSFLRVANLPSGTVCVPIYAFGFSNTQDSGPFGPYALPANLDPLGWIGCQQLVSLEILEYAIATTGAVDHPLTIPYVPAWVGIHFFVQACVLYHPAGVAVTNAIQGVVGY